MYVVNVLDCLRDSHHGVPDSLAIDAIQIYFTLKFNYVFKLDFAQYFKSALTISWSLFLNDY